VKPSSYTEQNAGENHDIQMVNKSFKTLQVSNTWEKASGMIDEVIFKKKLIAD
jgi:hypothetical protein